MLKEVIYLENVEINWLHYTFGDVKMLIYINQCQTAIIFEYRQMLHTEKCLRCLIERERETITIQLSITKSILPSNLHNMTCCLYIFENVLSSIPDRWNSAMIAFRNNFSCKEPLLKIKHTINRTK